MAEQNNHHSNRNGNHHGRGKGHHSQNRDNRERRENREYRENKEIRENKEFRENKETRENKESRENKANRDSRDNQVINTFTLGTKDLDDKNAQFQYDKGWYSIVDVVGEEKNVVYKSRNAQEAYLKWNVYIWRKKERPQRSEKTE